MQVNQGNGGKTSPQNRARYENVPDERLFSLYKDGDEKAFTEIFDRYNLRLLAFARRVIRDEAKAEDIVQETFFRAHHYSKRFDETKKFSTWIYTITYRLCLNEIRDRSRSPLRLMTNINAEMDPSWFASGERSPLDECVNNFFGDEINRAIEKLPDIHREMVELRYAHGKSYEMVSEMTGVTLGTVKSRLNRARGYLARSLADTCS